MEETNETAKLEDFIVSTQSPVIDDSQDAERNKCIHMIVKNWICIIEDDDTEKTFALRTLEDLLCLSFFCLKESVQNAIPEQHSSDLMCKSLLNVSPVTQSRIKEIWRYRTSKKKMKYQLHAIIGWLFMSDFEMYQRLLAVKESYARLCFPSGELRTMIYNQNKEFFDSSISKLISDIKSAKLWNKWYASVLDDPDLSASSYFKDINTNIRIVIETFRSENLINPVCQHFIPSQQANITPRLAQVVYDNAATIFNDIFTVDENMDECYEDEIDELDRTDNKKSKSDFYCQETLANYQDNNEFEHCFVGSPEKENNNNTNIS